MLAEILRTRPQIRGTLVDLPRTVARSGGIFQAAGVADHATTVHPQTVIEHFGTIGRCHDNDADIRLEAVHAGEQLIERLFAFIADYAHVNAPLAPDRIEFVDEDDGRRL